MRTFAYILLIFLSVFSSGGQAGFAVSSAAAPAADRVPEQAAAERTPGQVDWVPVPGPGKKVKINEDYVFTYEFNQKPQMGTVILVIKVFDQTGAQVVPFAVTGRSDMPSMRGAHDSGDVPFRTNRVNNYLMPVNVVMPGDWEIRITFSLNEKAVFHGSIRFDV